MSLACGIDAGGTKIAGGVVDESGRILAEAKVESPAHEVEAIEDAIVSLVQQLGEKHELSAVGVGAAGYVDADRSTVLFAPNLAWRDVNLKAELEPRLALPVVVENDANAAAWGEFAFGAGHDVDDLLLVTVGTGIGGGVVIDGSLFRGAFGVGIGDRPPARRTRRAAVRVRQPRLLRAVRQRQGSGPERPRRGLRRIPAGATAARPGGW